MKSSRSSILLLSLVLAAPARPAAAASASDEPASLAPLAAPGQKKSKKKSARAKKPAKKSPAEAAGAPGSDSGSAKSSDATTSGTQNAKSPDAATSGTRTGAGLSAPGDSAAAPSAAPAAAKPAATEALPVTGDAVATPAARAAAARSGASSSDPGATPGGYRQLRAIDDVKTERFEAPVLQAAEAPSPRSRLRAMPRAALLLPRTELSTGPLLGAEAALRMPWIEGRLRAHASLAWAFVSFQGPRIVPGRGFDPSFIQKTHLLPLEVFASYTLVETDGGFEASAGLGLGLWFSSTTLQALNQVHAALSFDPAWVVDVRAQQRLGPGALVADVRYAELDAELGSLDAIGVGTLSGVVFGAGYALDF